MNAKHQKQVRSTRKESTKARLRVNDDEAGHELYRDRLGGTARQPAQRAELATHASPCSSCRCCCYSVGEPGLVGTVVGKVGYLLVPRSLGLPLGTQKG